MARTNTQIQRIEPLVIYRCPICTREETNYNTAVQHANQRIKEITAGFVYRSFDDIIEPEPSEERSPMFYIVLPPLSPDKKECFNKKHYLQSDQLLVHHYQDFPRFTPHRYNNDIDFRKLVGLIKGVGMNHPLHRLLTPEEFEFFKSKRPLESLRKWMSNRTDRLAQYTRTFPELERALASK